MAVEVDSVVAALLGVVALDPLPKPGDPEPVYEPEKPAGVVGDDAGVEDFGVVPVVVVVDGVEPFVTVTTSPAQVPVTAAVPTLAICA